MRERFADFFGALFSSMCFGSVFATSVLCTAIFAWRYGAVAIPVGIGLYLSAGLVVALMQRILRR